MKSLSILLSLIFGALLSCTVYAVDIPQDDIADQKLNSISCVDGDDDQCSEMCMNSEDTDCQSKCDKLVREKCQNQVDN